MKHAQNILVCGVFFLLLFAHSEGANLLVNSSFETSEDTLGFPTTTGDWGGDESAIVSTLQGITPRTGAQMLQFIYAAGTAGSPSNSQVSQLIDLAPFAADVASGNAVANASFYANRVPGDASTDTQFLAIISAHTGTVASYPGNVNTFIAQEIGETFTDGSLSTWELVTVQMTIPVGASYLSYQVIAGENVVNDISGTEFDGHYADDATLEITTVPEPSQTLLVLIGLGTLFLHRHRDSKCNN